MKIRIKGNSLRYRLTRSDVAGLERDFRLEERIDFAGQSLTYILQSTADEQLSATFADNIITLFMPKTMIAGWAETERVGFENNSGPLHLLVEKDFTCLENVAEDQSDNYPNPLATNT